MNGVPIKQLPRGKVGWRKRGFTKFFLEDIIQLGENLLEIGITHLRLRTGMETLAGRGAGASQLK